MSMTEEEWIEFFEDCYQKAFDEGIITAGHKIDVYDPNAGRRWYDKIKSKGGTLPTESD